MMRLDPLGDVSVGAIVSGLRLTEITSSVAAQLLALLQRCPLLIFRRQTMEPDEHVEVAGHFGPLERHRSRSSSIRVDPHIFQVGWNADDGHTNAGCYWHQDGCTRNPPTRVATYRVPFMPARGGDTLFVRAGRPLAGASRTLADFLRRTTWTHASGIRHPFVRPDPSGTGETLCINLGKTTAIEGLMPSEVESFLSELSDLVENSDPYRHRWEAGDFLLVDNTRTLHRAEPAIADQRRILHRVSILEASYGSNNNSTDSGPARQ
jgi:taurine dioxygenase